MMRALGDSGINVSPIGFGGASLLSRVGRSESYAALEAAFDTGINLYDTAPLYGQGGSEALIGEFCSGRRDQVILCTKFGQTASVATAMPAAATAGLKNLVRPLIRRSRRIRGAVSRVLARRTIRQFNACAAQESLEQSLRRLKTDYVDLFLAHSPSIDELRQGEWCLSLHRLRERGLIRCYGVACNEPDEALAAMEFDLQLRFIQFPYSLDAPGKMRPVIEEAQRKGIAIMTRAPLAKGRVLDFTKANGGRRERALKQVAYQRGITLAQVAMLFVLSEPWMCSAIVSMLRPLHLSENTAVATMPPLTEVERQILVEAYTAGPSTHMIEV